MSWRRCRPTPRRPPPSRRLLAGLRRGGALGSSAATREGRGHSVNTSVQTNGATRQEAVDRPAPRRRPRRPAPLPHRTRAEREARGKAARRETPLEAHAAMPASPLRPDPVTLLEEQGRTRVPELVPIRYGRMLTSPFAFFRGAALPMVA